MTLAGVRSGGPRSLRRFAGVSLRMDSLQACTVCVEPLAVLSRFRLDLHACLDARCGGLFELRDRVGAPEFLKAERLLSVTIYNRRVTMTSRTTMVPRQIRGRTVGHWTARYIRARVREALYQQRHPDVPWLTPEAVRLLDSMLRPSDIGAEFGSGRSTSWLARRCAHLTSVEHDEAWYATVSATLAADGITHVDYQYHPRDKPDAPGDRSGYAQVAQFLGDESIDFALVDGLYRDYVTLFLLPKIKPGGMLIIDDAHRYLPSLSMSPLSLRPTAAPATAGWEQAAAALAWWRQIWTSSGVSDTAIFVKTSGARNLPL